MSGPDSEELLAEIHRLKEELGETPTSTEMNELGEYWNSHYYDCFGGWNNALREAGLEPHQEKKIPSDDLLNELRRLARELGTTPTKAQLDDLGEYYSRSYLDRFGSWNAAVRQAGLEPNQRIDEAEFRDPPGTCPLCETASDGRLDFHHWRYGENKVGCYLCRECHDRVHAGGARPKEDADWLLKAVENLIRDHKEYHGDTFVTNITERYNIPSEGLVECVLQDMDV